jgi:hypothetical protein
MLRKATGWRSARMAEEEPVIEEMEAAGYDLEVWRRMPTERERARWMAKGNN